MEAYIIAFIFSFIAGISTGAGSLIVLFIKNLKRVHLSIFIGFSAGVMIYISFMELLFTAIIDTGFLFANVTFFIGILAIAVLDFFIPHEYKEEHPPEDFEEKYEKLGRTSLLVALGIAIHNFPEGLVAFFGALKDINLGLLLLVAIALHNIPEGVSVAFPIYYATGERKKAFLWSFLSGIAEPVGAIIGFLVLYPFVNDFLLSVTLAFVAGIMIFISFDELLPLSLKHGEEHIAIISLFFGMLMISTIQVLFTI